MDLIYFILCSYGMTFILVYGSIFNAIRPTSCKLGELFHCPLCIGFWSGVFLWSINDLTELFNYDYNLANAFIMGCVSAGTSYFLSSVIEDNGFSVNINKR